MASRFFIPVFLCATALTLSAVPGRKSGLYELARLYDIGNDSVAADSARSTALYLKAAEEGDARAMNYLGFRYFKGEYVGRDIDSALFWLGKAVEAGDPGAANNLGFLYASGMGVEKDYAKAREWFEKASAAGIHSAEAQLADLYCLGLGGETDTVAALDLYHKAARAGISEAGVKRAELLKTLADRGDARAMRLLGEAYSMGEGVRYNHQLATEYFLRGALAGDSESALVMAELLEIFPDALKSDTLKEIIRENLGCEEIPAEISSPAYWYDKSGAGMSVPDNPTE